MRTILLAAVAAMLALPAKADCVRWERDAYGGLICTQTAPGTCMRWEQGYGGARICTQLSR